ncbi:hypothetical protein TWF694_009440 [Orbilia ellipsospora]|uniref:Uncharacterized protein n=1 Tax=Orbilia ellipsospora TaxID=2528407 RepID=A0AAV9XAS7_9PEZI
MKLSSCILSTALVVAAQCVVLPARATPPTLQQCEQAASISEPTNAASNGQCFVLCKLCQSATGPDCWNSFNEMCNISSTPLPTPTGSQSPSESPSGKECAKAKSREHPDNDKSNQGCELMCSMSSTSINWDQFWKYCTMP